MVLEQFLKHGAASRPFLRLWLPRRRQVREQAIYDVVLDRPFERLGLALFRLFEWPVEDLFLGATMRSQFGFEILEEFPPLLASLLARMVLSRPFTSSWSAFSASKIVIIISR
jgi:hypothetical protein